MPSLGGDSPATQTQNRDSQRTVSIHYCESAGTGHEVESTKDILGGEVPRLTAGHTGEVDDQQRPHGQGELLDDEGKRYYSTCERLRTRVV